MIPVLLATAAHAFTPEDCPFGVNAHQADTDALQQAAAAGARWVRFDMNWHQFEPAKGQYDWAIADRFMADAAANDLEVFVTIAYGPAWAGPPGCSDADPSEWNWCRNAVPSVQDWTDFVTAAVSRYGGQVKAWGMWNEPNLSHFFRGTRDDYVNTILIPGSDAVHAACADCLVLGPELANLRGANWDSDAGQCLFGECIFNGWEVSLREILIAAGPYIDVITHHKYADPADTLWSEAIDGEWLIIQIMHGIKEITDAEAPGKPVWITEMGWETTPGGPHAPQYAADQLYEAYAAFPEVQAGTWSGTTSGAWPELQRMFWYDLTDDPTILPDGDQYTWGLLDSAGLPKETWFAYRDVVADLGGCDDPPTGTGTGGTGTGGTGTGGATTGSTGSSTGGPGGTTTDPGEPPAPVDTGDPASAPPAAPPAGCGCAHGTSAAPWWLLGVAALLGWRRGPAPSPRASARGSGP